MDMDMKVTYHTGTKIIDKYIEFTAVYHQMLQRLFENCLYEHDDSVCLYWIGKFIK